MKNTFIILMLLLSFAAIAGINKVDKTKEAKAREWIKNQPLEFVENKGQFMRTDGKAADEVLFKTSFGGCDIYITDKGLSYVFVKMEEVEQSEIPRAERIGNGNKEFEDPKLKYGERKEVENKKVSYYRLDMNLEGASISKSNIIKENESKQGHYNYFYAHCPEGIYDVKGYGKITIKNIYKGIDWVIYTNSNSKEHPLKYDFVVHPEADYKDIKIKFLNAQSTSLSNNDTKLKIETIAGNIEEGNLYSYQSNSNNEISSKYIIDKDSIISFEIANYDTTKTLVIDPLVWATYYGDYNSDWFYAINVDSKRNIYLTGATNSLYFPVLQLTGAFWQSNPGGELDISIIKFNSKGVRLWATYYGGIGGEVGTSMCIDSYDNLYITGMANSQSFPIQQMSGAYNQMVNSGSNDIIIIKFNEQGIRLWATFYGGNKDDYAYAINVNNKDHFFIIGRTHSSDFPTKQLIGAFWQQNNNSINDLSDGFIIEFNNQGERLWATYYGGSSLDEFYSICFDNKSNIYIAGQTVSTDFPTQQLAGAYWQPNFAGGVDAIILKFNNKDQRLWATYFGGSSIDAVGNFSDGALAVDKSDNIYIVGATRSTDLPLKIMNGAFIQSSLAGEADIFILKFDSLGIIQWSTYYGGSNIDYANSILIDLQKNIYITGCTMSTDFPVKSLAGEFNQVNGDCAFIIRFKDNCSLDWATYIGAWDGDVGNDIAVDCINSVYITGIYYNVNGYTVDYGNGAYYDNSWNGSTDSFILKITNCSPYIPSQIQIDRNNICPNENEMLTLKSNNTSCFNLKWYSNGCRKNYLGQGNSLTIHSPKQTTTYYANWENDCDSLICDSITVYVKNCDIPFYFPNSFTPSGDGLNEVFKIETLAEFTIFKLLIFNRWGEQIFESNDKNKGWDGNFNGKKAPFGVYVYKFSGSIVDSNEQLNKTGRVTLIR